MHDKKWKTDVHHDSVSRAFIAADFSAAFLVEHTSPLYTRASASPGRRMCSSQVKEDVSVDDNCSVETADGVEVVEASAGANGAAVL